MGKYQALNVLNQRSFLDDLQERDAVNEVTAMINASGNRSTRRKVEKALNKTQNITKYANKGQMRGQIKNLLIKQKKI